MNMFSNMKIGRKLGLVFGGAVLLLLCIAGMAIWALHAADASSLERFDAKRSQTVSNAIEADLAEVGLNLGFAVDAENGEAEALAAVDEHRKAYKQGFDELSALATDDEDHRLLTNIEQAVANWKPTNDQIIQLLRVGKRPEAIQLYNQTARVKMEAVTAAVNAQVAMTDRDMDRISKEHAAFTSRINFILVGAGLFAVILAVFSGIVVTRSIVKPLEVAVSYLGAVARGDLSRDVEPELLTRGDEAGTLAKAMQAMCVGLRQVINEITGGIHVLSSSSAELSASSNQMSDSSRRASDKSHSVAAGTEQMSTNVVSVAAGIEETTTNLANVSSATGQMTATISEIAGNSEKARRITTEASAQATRITEQMQQLGHAAREIDKVTETITEISSQTSLLALNATIEAARAGAAGKGFAVVANEIKELAQQTAASTDDIKARVAGVQSSAASGIAEIEKVSQVIHEVRDLVCSIAAAIEEQSTVARDIAQNISEASKGVADANVSFAQTSQVTKEIAREISEVDQATTHMSDATEEIRRSATELSKMAEQLTATVGRFRL